MNKSSESYKVYLEKSEAAKSGVHSSQPEGRTGLPKAEAVRAAVAEPKGTAKKCTDKQMGENRLPLNRHVEKHQGE